jgi:hypothetical protein
VLQKKLVEKKSEGNYAVIANSITYGGNVYNKGTTLKFTEKK